MTFNEECLSEFAHPNLSVTCNNFEVINVRAYVIIPVSSIPRSHPHVTVIARRLEPEGADEIGQQCAESFSTCGETIQGFVNNSDCSGSWSELAAKSREDFLVRFSLNECVAYIASQNFQSMRVGNQV